MNDTTPARRSGEPARYAIRVRGHLADRWSQQFDGFSLTRQEDGTSVLSGLVTDQAALHGLLHKVRDLGLPLLSVTPLPETDDAHDDATGRPSVGTTRSTSRTDTPAPTTTRSLS